MNHPFTRPVAETRIRRLHAALCAAHEHWDAAVLVDKLHHYYFTGTMQDGVFVLLRDGSYAYFVRRSMARAREECLIAPLYPMTRYRDMADTLGVSMETLCVEAKTINLLMMERLKSNVGAKTFLPLDGILSKLRAVKDEHELECTREAGRQHGILKNELVPALLREGMNEAELTAEIFTKMVSLGYQGVTRFSMFQTEMVAGQFGFGDNAIYPTSFDSPGGIRGHGAYAPLLGDRSRTLRRGDLVFVDIGYGYRGYHTDSTQVYQFGGTLDPEVLAIHRACVELQRRAAAALKTGALPCDVYSSVMDTVPEAFLENFMGVGAEAVKFLGHGVGLQVDEYPVIARGFTQPLESGMVIALEPKKSLPGLGLVGGEDTYLVTPDGGECITGGERDIILV